MLKIQRKEKQNTWATFSTTKNNSESPRITGDIKAKLVPIKRKRKSDSFWIKKLFFKKFGKESKGGNESVVLCVYLFIWVA